jgi:DNA polymerase-3 subunit epsilon/ATP-dependent DNA helicase DinG
MKQIYIALDLETTGFDPVTDQVLEIAAVKFQGNKILETFETLVNPGTEIPAMVSHITGISDETIKDAPSFEEVSDNLSRFLADYPIVGHNIDFDLTFLEAKGIPILSRQIDTLKLANILLPELPSLSLDTISRQLKIRHEQKHRALSDAKVCVELFQILSERISQIPAPVLRQIQTLIPRSNWDLGELFMEAKAKPGTPRQPDNVNVPQSTFVINQTLENEQDFIGLLGENSPINNLIENYEYRNGQQLLLKKILQAFREKFNLIAEAGTGTGKTMAYLMAAAHIRKFQGKKVLISTYTNNLQDQIVGKDFPLIQKIFPDLKIAVLKGRKKYFDHARFRQLLEKPVFEEHQLTSVIKILIWLNRTETGDLDELNLQNKETQIYEEICSDPEYVPLTSHPGDFLEKARRKAENADIVVVNHALLIQDHLTDKNILPESEILIVDEAHHLEKTLTDGLTVSLSFSRLSRVWEKFFDSLSKLKATDFPMTDLAAFHESSRKISINSLSLTEKLFETCRLIIEKNAGNSLGQPVQIGISQAVADSDYWNRCRSLSEEIILPLSDLENLADQFIKKLIAQDITDSETPGTLRDLLGFYHNLKSLFEQPQNKIIWLNRGFDESIHLNFAPLTVREIFAGQIFPDYQSIVLTSATLSTFGNFSYIRSELGLGESFEDLMIPSHFSYPDQVKIIIPEDLTDPKNPQYIEQCSSVINSVITQNGGRTLVLFTAKKDLARIFHDLAPDLKTRGINLLAQNLSGGRGKIISHFQDEPANCAILGTNSFWEGVDLIGPILTCVIIQKLPFDPPDDPIIRARSAQFARPFEQYSLPRAILRFKQGFGRLIRSSRDTGAVIILDSRLVQKSYGREFIASLPQGIRIHQCSESEVSDYL